MPSTEYVDILREQEELGCWIQRFWTNLCKLGREKVTRAVLEQRRGLLERYWDAFLNGHRQLLRFREAEGSAYVDQDHFSTIEEAYLQVAAQMAQYQEDLAKAGPSRGVQAPPDPPAMPQLPEIQLPTFSGYPLQWESFRDLFRSLVHSVPNLPDVQKFLYLKTALTGEAAEVIQNTPITDAGYQGAWEDLEQRYGNLRFLSFSHHQALLSCSPAQQQSAAELKRLLDTFRQSIRAYTALNKPVPQWDEWFVYFLSQKLDKTTHLAWETSLADSRDIPSFRQLSLFMENRIQALDAAQAADPVLHPATTKDALAKTKKEAPVKRTNVAVLAASAKSPAPPTTRPAALLATAKVRVEAPSGEHLEVRALLDTGSDTSLVSGWVVQALRLPRRAVSVAISGVQENESGLAKSEVSLSLRSRLDPSFHLSVRALVLRKLTALLPARAVQPQSWPHLQGVILADPEYGVPSRVDLILGADICGVLLQDESRVGPIGTPTARRMPLGWVLMGPVSDAKRTSSKAVVHSLHCQTDDSTNRLLRRFWELEELHEQPPLSPEDRECERHFRETHYRDETGRYSVHLPFKLDPSLALKPSRSTALKLLLSCERKLASNEAWRDKYSQFMDEYAALGHMEAVPESAVQDPAYYLPHHAVAKRYDPTDSSRPGGRGLEQDTLALQTR
ncbi:uncharacterized protein LOC143305457 [Osmia lignaria lignaria]|uniref:uncharacterized protein LOC143305457 n=1 Tax=Osmia lignaria lignaria TaxID=1437193 RepID=UPI00402BA8B1